MHIRPAYQPFLSLMLPQKGQPFPPERRNCSRTFQGVLQFRLPSAPQRYNTLDFPGKVVCQQGCCSPLLETQSQRSYAPLDTPLCSCRGHLSHLGLLDFSCPNMKPSHRFNSLFNINNSYVYVDNYPLFLYSIIKRGKCLCYIACVFDKH